MEKIKQRNSNNVQNSMEAVLIKITVDEKEELNKMLSDYFTEIPGANIEDRNTKIEFEYPYLELYWKEENRIPYKIYVNNKIVGFVLINDWIVCKEFGADKSIAEYYIKPKFRRLGIGKSAAHKLFKKYKGKWEIRQSSRNTDGIKFWRHVVGQYTQENYVETENKQKEKTEIIQLFES